MRIVFLVALLAGAVFYSYVAFADLNFLSRTGRLGPGFFPRIIGVAAVAMTLWAIVDILRARRRPGAAVEQWRDVGALIALALGYAALLRLFGGFPATVAFLAAALFLLNRGRPVTNALVAVLAPCVVYLLFDGLLNTHAARAHRPAALSASPREPAGWTSFPT